MLEQWEFWGSLFIGLLYVYNCAMYVYKRFKNERTKSPVNRNK